MKRKLMSQSEIISKYQSGLTLAQVGQLAGRSASGVHSIITKAGIACRSRGRPRQIDMEQLHRVRSAACEVFGVSIEDLLSKCREREIVVARQAIALIATQCGMSLDQIGTVMNRDHTTILHSRRAATERLKDRDFAWRVERVRSMSVASNTA